MIKGIHHVGISTPDLDRICCFYRDVVGFEPVGEEFAWEPDTDIGKLCDTVVGLKGSSARSIMLKKADMIIEFFEYRRPEPKPRDPETRVCDHGYTHICLQVEDIDHEYERLKSLGMIFHAAPPPGDPGGLRAIYGKDPDGNVVELMEELAA